MILEPNHFVLVLVAAAAGCALGLRIGTRRGKREGAAARQALEQRAEAEQKEQQAKWNMEREKFAAQEAAFYARLHEHERNRERLEKERATWEARAQTMDARLRETEIALAKLRVQAEAGERTQEERIKLFAFAREELRSEFKQLSQQIFEEKTEKLGQHSEKLVEGVIFPLREQLGEFKKKIEDVYDKEAKDRVSLAAQVEQLHKHSQTLSQQALHLTQALTGQSKVRGMWGEQTLEALLEASGLVKGVEYVLQKTLKTEEGNRRQPDVIIHLPDKRHIVIDAKVSLLSYLAYCEGEDEDARQAAILGHLASLRAHIHDLSSKDYASLLGEGGVDFVLLFVPIEPALLVALKQDPELSIYAYRRKIILVGSTTLLATLRTIEGIWRFERQSKNAEEIARQAGELWDQMARTLESLDALGKNIDGAQAHFADTMKRLCTGRGNLKRRAEVLKQLGVKGKKEFPPAIMARLGSEEEDRTIEETAVHTLLPASGEHL